MVRGGQNLRFYPTLGEGARMRKQTASCMSFVCRKRRVVWHHSLVPGIRRPGVDIQRRYGNISKHSVQIGYSLEINK